eukprot:gene15850-15986_t
MALEDARQEKAALGSQLVQAQLQLDAQLENARREKGQLSAQLDKVHHENGQLRWQLEKAQREKGELGAQLGKAQLQLEEERQEKCELRVQLAKVHPKNSAEDPTFPPVPVAPHALVPSFLLPRGPMGSHDLRELQG